MNILVSACLLGISCRYDHKSQPCEELIKLSHRHTLIPVCPEQLGGLSTPRPAAEIIDNQVINTFGQNVTREFVQGANAAVFIAMTTHCSIAILKEKSPSCGTKMIYDGTFSKNLTKGIGICAKRLHEHGIPVYGESEIKMLSKNL